MRLYGLGRAFAALASICTCALRATEAFPAPVEPPGELLEVAFGTPLKAGHNLFDTAAYGGAPNGSRDGFDIAVLLASLPSTPSRPVER